MEPLSSALRRALRARAHSLDPVVGVSVNGLSEAVLNEIDRSLKAHELIKVRVYGEERGRREELLSEICERLGAIPVQHIGNIVVVYRENPEAGNPSQPQAQATPSPRRR
ncbi:MAG: YhbY family RNA-binding protein [Pseudomonadota bacterium]|jgi:putative YhbY family RNA-binding protein